MGQALHGSARTIAAVCQAIRDSQESMRALVTLKEMVPSPPVPFPLALLTSRCIDEA
jgi:hypothetical protein